MARPLRLEFPGAVYHLTSRGNARQKIFLTDADRELFLQEVVVVRPAARPTRTENLCRLRLWARAETVIQGALLGWLTIGSCRTIKKCGAEYIFNERNWWYKGQTTV
jgi:hypothetical protein